MMQLRASGGYQNPNSSFQFSVFNFQNPVFSFQIPILGFQFSIIGLWLVNAFTARAKKRPRISGAAKNQHFTLITALRQVPL
jgi:hypothetical protein